ncbi:MAG TPA: hypothetical protein VFJ13_05770 [Paracoccaceae bacterium]|nr:hypothetical protein [Paracoccaceae bacterium]
MSKRSRTDDREDAVDGAAEDRAIATEQQAASPEARAGLVHADATKDLPAGVKLRIYAPAGVPVAALTVVPAGNRDGETVELRYPEGVTVEEMPIRRVVKIAPGVTVQSFRA